MPGWISPWELLILVFVVLLIFGPKRLPQMGRSLGSGIRELKNSVKGHVDKQDEEAEQEQRQQAQQAPQELPPAPPQQPAPPQPAHDPRERDTVL